MAFCKLMGFFKLLYFVEIKAFAKINAWLFLWTHIQFICKRNLYFWKHILTSNFTPAPFDELKLTAESYFLSPVFLWI